MQIGISISSRVHFIGRFIFMVLLLAVHGISYGQCTIIQECDSTFSDPDSGGQGEATPSNCHDVETSCAPPPQPPHVDAELIASNTAAWDQSWLQNDPNLTNIPAPSIDNAPNSGQTGDGQTSASQTDCPVLLSELKKIEVQEDWTGTGEMPLNIQRTYISHPIRTGKNPSIAKTPEFQLGLGWRANFDRRIDFKTEANCRLSSNAAFSITTGCSVVSQQTEFRINGRLFKQNSSNPGLWVQSPLPDENAGAVFSNNQFVVTYNNGRIEKYDTYGRMLSITTLNGISHTYQYLDSTTSRIASITHSGGQTLVFNWTGSRLASISTPESLITYQHETITETGTSNYLLTKVIFPGDTGDIGFDYDYYSGYNWNRLTKVRLNGEIYKEITHSNIPAQNVEKSGLVGGVQRSTLTTGANKVTVTNALGAATVYEYDTPQRKHLIKIDRAGSSACPEASALYGYDEIPGSTGANIKYVKWKEDWTGNRTTYSYYDEEREILETEYADGHTIKYEWDSFNRPTKKTWWDGATSQVDCSVATCTQFVNEQLDDPLRVERYEYHDSSNKYRLKNLIEQDELGNERKSGYSYTFHGNSLPSKITLNGPRTDLSDITELEYDTKGRLTRKTNALGQSVTYTYTGNWEKPARITDATGMFTDFTYDARGRVIAIALNGSASLTTQYRYSRFGKVDRITRPNGSAEIYYYDNAGRLAGIERPPGNPALMKDIQGFSYDNLGNLLQQNHGYLVMTTQTIYTPGGPVTTQVPQMLNSTSTRREYDSAGNLLRELGNNGQIISYTYTPNLQVKTIKDALNRTTQMDYTGKGLLQRITRSDATQVNFVYDPLSRLTDVTDPRNKATQYRFDQGFMQARTESPDTQSSVTLYNSAGLAGSVQREDGTLVSYQYDALNRLTSVQSTGAHPQNASYSYDTCAYGQGRLCQITDNSGSTQYAYTTTGKVAGKTQVIGGTAYITSLAYDAHDRLAEISTDNGGARLRYSYDANSEVNKVEAYLNNTWLLVADHKPHAQKRTLTYGNGLSHVRDFDFDGRVTKITASGFTKTYSYDVANRITRINGGSAGDYYYQYDSNDRLAKELYSNSTTDSRSYQYTYDANGNRTSRQQGTTSTAYTIDANSNRLMNAGSTSYVYTSTGNLSSVNSGQRALTYDGFDRLRTYNHTDGSQGTYSYNFMNLRVSKTAKVGSGATETTRYLYTDSGQLLAETLPNSNTIGTNYIWFQGQIVGFIRGGSLYYVFNDHLGRPETIYRRNSASTQTLVWQARNLAFTREIATNTLGEFNIGLPGQYYDKESGLWYNWHRYYDASIGRYIQSDPIGINGGLNTYAYVKNNPIDSSDPTGLFMLTVNYGSGPYSSATMVWNSALPSFYRSGTIGSNGTHIQSGIYQYQYGQHPMSPSPGRVPYPALNIYMLDGDRVLPATRTDGGGNTASGINFHKGNSIGSSRSGSKGCHIIPDENWNDFISEFEPSDSGLYIYLRF